MNYLKENLLFIDNNFTGNLKLELLLINQYIILLSHKT